MKKKIRQQREKKGKKKIKINYFLHPLHFPEAGRLFINKARGAEGRLYYNVASEAKQANCMCPHPPWSWIDTHFLTPPAAHKPQRAAITNFVSQEHQQPLPHEWREMRRRKYRNWAMLSSLFILFISFPRFLLKGLQSKNAAYSNQGLLP